MRLLVIAYYFPPSQASGVFRSLAFVRYLAAQGWEITVLTVEAPMSKDDDCLLAGIPDNVRIVRAKERDLFAFWTRLKQKKKGFEKEMATHRVTSATDNADGTKSKKGGGWVKKQLSALLTIPDSQSGWLLPGYCIGRILPQPDVIYSSGPPFTDHVIGTLLKKKWNVPLVTDFRDPWGGNPFRVSYGGPAEKWDCFLEGWVYRNSARIIANTNPMAKMIAGRFSGLQHKITVITNGYSQEELADIEPVREVPKDRLLFLHPGVLYGRRNPLPFLSAVREAVHDRGMEKILVLLIGRYETFNGKPLKEHITEMQLTDHVRLLSFMSHDQVLSLMKGADLLLLLAVGTTLQVPAKLFEYLGIGRPIFAVCEPESATLQIMNKQGSGHYCMNNSRKEILQSIKAVYSTWQQDGLPRCLRTRKSTAFDRSVLSSRLDAILREELSGKSPMTII